MFKRDELKPRTRRPEKPNTDAISFFLVADGTDTKLVDALRAEAAKGGAEVKVVARKVGGARAADGTIIHADFQLAGGPSVLFDAAYVALSADGAAMMSKEAAAVGWVHDAFSHLMVIGATTDARPLLTAAGVVADERVLIGIRPADYLSKVAHGRIYDREANLRTQF